MCLKIYFQADLIKINDFKRLLNKNFGVKSFMIAYLFEISKTKKFTIVKLWNINVLVYI